MGTPDFAVESLKKIYENGHNIKAVISQPDRKSGRGMNVVQTPVKEYALSKNLPVYQPEKIRKDEELIEKIKQMKPDMKLWNITDAEKADLSCQRFLLDYGIILVTPEIMKTCVKCVLLLLTTA